MMRRVIAIDPGRDKCGVAVVAFAEKGAHRVLDIDFIEREVVSRATVIEHLAELIERFSDAVFVLGNATTSRALRLEIEVRFAERALYEQDETGSTLEARALYWRAKPPRGWRKVWPLSLQNPPEPIDDFAAIVLAQRFLARTGDAENSFSQ